MKKILLLGILTSGMYVNSQVLVNSSEYQTRKANNSLEGLEVVSNPDGSFSKTYYIPDPSIVSPKTDGCNCYVEPDGTYILAMDANDDGSSDVIDLPFDFCFYGQTYNQLYINNNGNITFENDLFTFNSNAFPSPDDKIIAPFWADVDTRGAGQVVYKITPTSIHVNWVAVGYYNSESDKLNSFQLTLTDGTDPELPNGNNIAFCYKDMQWTTGAASQGVDGFGGVPATAGANKGDNIGFFQVAQFDHPGTDFDGALGNPDGISWLDNKSFYFNICNNSNIPPIPDGISSCDTFTLCALSDTANLQIKFLSPEEDQTTTLLFSTTNGLIINEIENIPGNTASIILQAIALPGNEGYHTVTVTATDDFVPAGVTSVVFTVYIDPFNGTDIDPLLTPLESCGSATLNVLNGPYDTYLWDDLSVMDTLVADTAMVYGVTVSRNGCYKRIANFIQIAEPIFFDFNGSLVLCEGAPDAVITLSDSLEYSSITWNGAVAPERDMFYTNNLGGGGPYTISVVDSAGLCTKDTTFSINASTALFLQADDAVCSSTYDFNANVAGSGAGTWTFDPALSAGTPIFADPSDINTFVTFPVNGTYTLIYTDANCPYEDDVVIQANEIPMFNMESDYFACPNGTEFVYLADSTNLGQMRFRSSDPLANIYSANLPAGTHTATLFNSNNTCSVDTTFTIGTQANLSLEQDQILCVDNYQFTGNIASSGTGTWTFFSPTGGTPTFSSNSVINPSITFTQDGLYSLIYTDANCPSVFDSVGFAVSSTPEFNINSDFYDCLNQTELTTIDLTNIATIVWDVTLPQFNNQASVQLTAGTYTASIVDLLGCTNDTTFTVNSQPLIQITDFEDICGLQLVMTNNPVAPAGSWVQISGSGTATFSAVTAINNSITVDEFGTYEFKYNESVCQDADTITVSFIDNPTVNVDDASICAGAPYELVATSNVVSAGLIWSTNEIGNSIIVNQKDTYIIEATNLCGTAIDSALIDIRLCEIAFPNIFTPGGTDVLNEKFQVLVPSDAFTNFTCQIFNRWGNLVYEYFDVFGGWNGKTLGNDDATPGTYFYKVSAKSHDGEDYEFQGFVQLVR
jgi:gliding motility-associated-like protein